MYSVVVGKEVLDFKYKKLNEFTYAFYIGDILIGQIFKLNKSWAAVTHKPNALCPVYGLKTRHYAAELMLKMGGYINI